MKESEILIYKRDNGKLEMSLTTEVYPVVQKEGMRNV